MRNRSHSLAADRLLQGFNRGQIAPKCVFPTDYALKPEKRLLAVRGEVNNYILIIEGLRCFFDSNPSIPQFPNFYSQYLFAGKAGA